MYIKKINLESCEDFTETTSFLKILQNANNKIIEKGEKMWETEKLNVLGLQQQYENAQYFLGFYKDVPAFTSVLMTKDVPFWGENSDQENAVYLHKFSIEPNLSGSGISLLALDCLSEEVKVLGFDKLRLDVRANKPKLISFYEKAQFNRIKEGEFYYGTGYLYERTCD